MSDRCSCDSIDARKLQAEQRRVLGIVLGINLTTFALMVAASIFSGSSSLLSGALDNFGDSITYALSFAVVAASGAAKARVALFKAAMIFAAALAVAGQIAWRAASPETPIVESMGVAALVNLFANVVCLRLLTPYRHGDVNVASAWECSRNDVFEGLAVIVTTGAVWLFQSGWPDLIVATALLVMFLRSALRVFSAARRELRTAAA